MRERFEMPISFKRPACTNGSVASIPLSTSCVLPAATSAMLCAPPRNGTCTNFMPVASAISTAPRWLAEPMPDDAMLIGLVFDSSASSLTLLAGFDGCVHSRCGEYASSVAPASCEGLYGSAFSITALIASDDMSDSSIVCSLLDCATAAAPTAPLAPVLFSTTTVVLSISPSGPLIRRAITSDVPPGGNGTMIDSGRSGHAAAKVNAGSGRVAAAALAFRMVRRVVMGASPQSIDHRFAH